MKNFPGQQSGIQIITQAPLREQYSQFVSGGISLASCHQIGATKTQDKGRRSPDPQREQISYSQAKANPLRRGQIAYTQTKAIATATRKAFPLHPNFSPTTEPGGQGL